jgi:CheY-like chemotaxis protein
VRIVVSDTGSGMDEQTLSKATEPFFTTKGLGKGTGLGLSMVHGLAGQLGGTLELSSTPGLGTRVALWLPVAENAAENIQSREPPESHTDASCDRTLRVLVVDDDALVSLGTAALLEDLGHHVVEANSGLRALEILNSGERLDLVITDQAMPSMTGTELAQKIAAVRPNLPVILASGYAELPDGPGVRDIVRLTKPFTQQQLETAIATVLPAKSNAA